MNLNDLLRLEGFPVDNATICLMRHTPRELGDYLIDPHIFNFYTSIQKRGRLDPYQYVIAFVVGDTGKTIFKGMYEVQGKSQLQSFHYESLALPSALLTHYQELEASGECNFYAITRSTALASYEGRLVVDWGKAAIAWFQKYSASKPKNVLEILPAGFFRPFDSYLSVSLTRPELEYLFAHANANPDWESHLSRVAGIYLILDEETGDQYIGSASGGKGIWGRWSNYAANPTGGNIKLKSLLHSSPDAYRRFRYSLLEVMPGNALKEEVLRKESLYKKKFGTRAFGLNQN
jgi:hypothetical protein